MTRPAATPAHGRSAGGLLTAAVALVAVTFSVCLFYPGFISYDSAYQYWQVRHQHFSNHQPVLMVSLWSILDRVWPSPAALLTFHFLVYWSGLALLAVDLFSRTAARMVFVLAVGFLPPAYLVMGHLWIDASLIATMTLGLALTVRGLLRSSATSLAAAVPVFVYAGAVRHNALPALVPIALLWGHAVLTAGGWAAAPAMRRRAAAATVGLAALVVALSLGVSKALDHWLVRERSPQFTLGILWDLAGISVHANTMLIPDFARTAGLSFPALRELYTPMTNVGLYAPREHVRHGLGDEAYTPTELAAIRTAWLRAIADHPSSYAIHRWDVTRNLFGRHDGDLVGLFFEPGAIPYEDNPPAPPDLWPLKKQLAEFVRARRGWPVFVPAVYLVLAVGVVAWSWRNRRDRRCEIALLTAASGLALALPLTLFAPSTDLRYSGWLFTSSCVGLAACMAAGRQR